MSPLPYGQPCKKRTLIAAWLGCEKVGGHIEKCKRVFAASSSLCKKAVMGAVSTFQPFYVVQWYIVTKVFHAAFTSHAPGFSPCWLALPPVLVRSVAGCVCTVQCSYCWLGVAVVGLCGSFRSVCARSSGMVRGLRCGSATRNSRLTCVAPSVWRWVVAVGRVFALVACLFFHHYKRFLKMTIEYFQACDACGEPMNDVNEMICQSCKAKHRATQDIQPTPQLIERKLREIKTFNHLQVVRLTTTSGHSWITNIAAAMTEGDAIEYFMGNRFDISSDPDVERLEKVVKVEYNPAD